MTEREMREGVMEKLARVLAEAQAPPCPRTRLTEALLNGEFQTVAENDDTEEI